MKKVFIFMLLTSSYCISKEGIDSDNINGAYRTLVLIRENYLDLIKRGNYRRALVMAQSYLKISSDNFGPNHKNTTNAKLIIADLINKIGLEEQKTDAALYALEIYDNSNPEDDASKANAREIAAITLAKSGKTNESLELLKKSLETRIKLSGENSEDAARSLHNISWVYHKNGDSENNILTLHRLLLIYEKNSYKNSTKILETTTSLSNVYSKTNRYGEALTVLYRYAGNNKNYSKYTRQALDQVAIIYRHLGMTEESISLSKKILEEKEQFDKNDLSIPETILNIYYAYIDKNDSDNAKLYGEKYISAANRIFTEPNKSTEELDRRADIYMSLGKYDEALVLASNSMEEKKLRLSRAHPSIAYSLALISEIQQKLGKIELALLSCERAMALFYSKNKNILTEHNWDHRILSYISSRYAYLLDLNGKKAGAIYYYKFSVNVRQEMQSKATNLSEVARRAYNQKLSFPYNELARLLIKIGSIDEAEKVLLLLKEADLKEYITRGSNIQTEGGGKISLTHEEEELHNNFKKISAAWTEFYDELANYENEISSGKRQVNNQYFSKINDTRLSLENRTNNWLTHASKKLSGNYPKISNQVAGTQYHFNVARTLIANKLSEIGQIEGYAAPRTAALTMLPSPRGLTLVVTTDKGATPITVQVSEEVLSSLVSKLRTALQAHGEYRPLAKSLYAHLIAPAEKMLGAAVGDIKQWAILPYGVLRNLPFGVLMDESGEHLIERYALVTLTADGKDSIGGLDSVPKSQWRGAGFGTSLGFSQYAPLHGVRAELCGIVYDPDSAADCQDIGTNGVINGQRYLNQKFTRDQLSQLMGTPAGTSSPNFLHIATHFKIAESLLLLGNGTTLELADIGKWNPRLGHYDLVALSACDSGKNENGVESIGGVFRQLGAKSVLATLWPVKDVGAGPLMVEFYRQRGAQRVMAKSEALRRAQLAMLRGELKNLDQPSIDLRDPYFWAGYVLMGNWLVRIQPPGIDSPVKPVKPG